MNEPVIKKSAWLLLLIALAAGLLISLALIHPYQNRDKTTVEPLRFSGSYRFDSNAPALPLTESTIMDACQNGFVLLQGTFDRELGKDTQILFFMEYLEVHIYQNGVELYAWGTQKEYPGFLRSAGAAWGHCDLPMDISAKDEITITLQSKYRNNYNSAYHDFLDSLLTGDSGALARKIAAENWQHLLLCVILFLLGFTLLFFALLLVRQGVPVHSSIYYCALFVLSSSLWTLLNPVYSTLVLDNAPLIMLLESVSLWLFTAFLFCYFGAFMRSRAKQTNQLLVFCYAASLLVFLVLQLFGVTDAYAVRGIHDALLISCVMLFMFIYRYEYRHGNKADMRTLMPVSILYLIFGVIEVCNYQFEWFTRGGSLTLGLYLFITVLLVTAVRKIRDSLLMALRAAELEKDLTESRTAVMLSQIQPHFLYNALTGIKTLCGSNPQQAEDAMEHFSYFLRSNLDSLSPTRLILFEKEICHVQDYFYLEKMRFKERVNLVLELEYRDFFLPPLTLQPLVENAVRYGLTKQDRGGTVTIHSCRQENQIVVTITDDGAGFDAAAPKEDGRSHTGIENVSSRLRLQCGGSLQIHSQMGVGTRVQITLPGEEGMQ